MTSSSASARSHRVVICLLASARRCLSSIPVMEFRSSPATGCSFLVASMGDGPAGAARPTGPGPGVAGHRAGVMGAGSGLDELVLLERLVPGDRQMAVVVFTVAAAAQLEPGRALVDRAAAVGRDHAGRHRDVLLDAAGLASLPVLDVELLGVGQDVGQVEVLSLADRREAEVEAPMAADAVPEPALKLDPEPDHEGLVALDDVVVLVLVVVDDVGIPVSPQMPRGQEDLGPAVEPVRVIGPAGHPVSVVVRHETSPLA